MRHARWHKHHHGAAFPTADARRRSDPEEPEWLEDQQPEEPRAVRFWERGSGHRALQGFLLLLHRVRVLAVCLGYWTGSRLLCASDVLDHGGGQVPGQKGPVPADHHWRCDAQPPLRQRRVHPALLPSVPNAAYTGTRRQPDAGAACGGRILAVQLGHVGVRGSGHGRRHPWLPVLLHAAGSRWQLLRRREAPQGQACRICRGLR
mmetsp:Transcript_95544/g.247015  ORF Transcript_95544/g.247015 Transcript_95544/m.247015 type:complete len:205 (-) Transcript_95544:541-1155(-)